VDWGAARFRGSRDLLRPLFLALHDVWTRCAGRSQLAFDCESRLAGAGASRAEAQGLAKGEAKGKTEGKAEGLAGALLRILARNRIAVDEKLRDEVLACRDEARLLGWIDKAIEAKKLTDVFD
jgi:hypothetical protein